MPPKPVAFLLGSLLLCTPLTAGAQDPVEVPMQRSGAATFNVPVVLGGSVSGEFLVDTGSSHMAIRESTLRELQKAGHARFVKNLAGRMADGSRQVVPIYRIDRIRIGERCTLEEVEAAVFPDSARPILGLSALRRAAPFRFSTEPPALVLDRCDGPRTARADGRTLAHSGGEDHQ